MRVRDLQQFLESFTARDKSASGQGNAISDAVIYVEVNGQLREIKKWKYTRTTKLYLDYIKTITLTVLS